MRTVCADAALVNAAGALKCSFAVSHLIEFLHVANVNLSFDHMTKCVQTLCGKITRSPNATFTRSDTHVHTKFASQKFSAG